MSTLRPIAPLGENEERPQFPRVQRRRKASTACNECRKHRSKCRVSDGASQCERCVQNKTECVVDATEDLRRKIAQKRQVQDLEEDRKLLYQLLETVADAVGETSDSYITGLVDLIRNRASLDELRQFHRQTGGISSTNNAEAIIIVSPTENGISSGGSDRDTEGESACESPFQGEDGSYARLKISNLVDGSEVMDGTEAVSRGPHIHSSSSTPEPAGSFR
ncbi:hypothetical protein BJX64DRAFT_193163 [Aspergillus heterothallicus]